MKSNIIKYSLSISFILFLIACSVKKDKFINRNFHAVTTEYNVLYNGNLALDKGLADLKTTYQDNFWEILPVERMPSNEEALLPGQTKNPNFERAEEKAGNWNGKESGLAEEKASIASEIDDMALEIIEACKEIQRLLEELNQY